MTVPPKPRVVDLRNVVDDPVVRGLLGSARCSPQVDDVDHLVDGHRANRRTRVALGIAQGEELMALVMARTPHAGVCEILAISDGDRQLVHRLVDGAADQLNAVAVSAQIRPEARPFWEGLGFGVRRDADDGSFLWAERHHPPVGDGFHSAPLVRVTSDRRVEIDLPPDGNTLPLVPEALRDRGVPAHVLGWVLDADATGHSVVQTSNNQTAWGTVLNTEKLLGGRGNNDYRFLNTWDGRVEIDNGNITIEAETKITLKAAQVVIDASGTAELKAGATCKVQGAMVEIN